MKKQYTLGAFYLSSRIQYRKILQGSDLCGNKKGDFSLQSFFVAQI